MLSTGQGRRAAAAWAKGHGIGDAFEQFSRSATRLAFARHRIVLGRDRAVAHYDESMLLDRLTEARRRMAGPPPAEPSSQPRCPRLGGRIF